MHDEFDHNEHALPAELAALEQQLAALDPVAPQVDRDRLMFAAGAASVQPGRLGYIADPSWSGRLWIGRRFWQSTTALATAASIALATMLVWNRAGRIPIPRPTAESASIASTPSDPFERREWPDRIPPGYLGLRQVALAHGVGQMEPTRSTASDAESIDVSPPATSRHLLQELLQADERSNS